MEDGLCTKPAWEALDKSISHALDYTSEFTRDWLYLTELMRPHGK